MIPEAIDTVITLGWALLVWIVLMAVAAGLALYAVVVAVWCAARGIRRAALAVAALRTHTAAPLTHELPSSDSSPARAAGGRSQPHAPTWAQTEQDA